MATGSKVQLKSSQQPEFYVKGLSAESADKTRQLLQINHEKHHIFFNQSGFHNHIAHHLLTLFALNASPSEIQKGYDINISYQQPAEPVEESIVDDMHKLDRFQTYLGNGKYYHDFLVFFQKEIDAKGWGNVLNEYLFANDDGANDLLSRSYAGFLHPIIHIGFGMEFQQPAIVAEGLAQAAVHDDWTTWFFLACEKAAEANRGRTKTKKTIVELLEVARNDEKLRHAAHWEDDNKIRDGILRRAPDAMIKLASQFTIEENELEVKTAEMINAAAYFTGTAQHPPHQIKFDFFYMHCVNSSIFFSHFLSAANAFLATSTKRRLLERKGWIDMAMYVSHRCPPLLLDEITNYAPAHDSGWPGIMERVRRFEDDGHSAKLVRALAHGQEACEK